MIHAFLNTDLVVGTRSAMNHAEIMKNRAMPILPGTQRNCWSMSRLADTGSPATWKALWTTMWCETMSSMAMIHSSSIPDSRCFLASHTPLHAADAVPIFIPEASATSFHHLFVRLFASANVCWLCYNLQSHYSTGRHQ